MNRSKTRTKVGMAIVGFLVIASLMVVGTATAKDIAINMKVSSVTEAVDRNGNAYTRIIVEENRILDGVRYTAGTALMAFGVQHQSVQAADIQAGDTVKAIVSTRTFNGRKSFTLQSLIE